ncbi:MAG: hypothetical protein RB288_02295 [Bacteroidales bacterium]|jgi:hypothetical protein|nr:hypothetical protein [Bacteroidales bacterium]
MYRTGRFVLICLFALLASGAAAQKNVYSPFARYGIGNMDQQGTFRSRAMGGISSGLRDNLTLNYLTPASYSSIDTASFLFDFGLDYGVMKLAEGDLTYYSQDLTFSHLMLGFPIIKGLGVAAAIVPYSNASYNIGGETSTDGVAGDLYEHHKGSGGYQKVLLGAGYSPFRYISAGMNMFLIFGEVTRLNDFLFTSDNNYFNTRKQGSIAMNGIGIEASMQVMVPLPDKWYVNAGFNFTPSFSLKTNTEDIIFRYSNYQTSILSSDTLFQATGTVTSRLPATLRGGIAIGKSDKFTAGADIVYTKWTEAFLPNTYGTYRDAISLHAGAEYIPDKYSNYSFFDRLEYRIGCRYGESYTLIEGDKLNEYGITFGAGIPMRRSKSRITLFVDLSGRGGTDDSMVRESRITVGASLNLFDYWFLKAKYD